MRGAWLLQLPGRHRRTVRRIGPPRLRAHLVVDERKLERNAQGARLQLLRHVATEHVAWLLDRLDVNVVLDVGANRGQYARELRSLGYRGRIVSFEPVPRTARVLERWAADDPDWQVHRCALGDADETLAIHEGARQGRLSSLLPATDFGRSWSEGIDADRTVEVPVRRLDGLWDEVVAGVAEPRVYLKLDTQGYDVRAFAGAGDRVRDVLAMQSEVSMLPLYEGMPHHTEQLATYEAAGFELAGMYPVIVDRPTLRVVEFDALLVRSPAADG
ncbi:FkbM family methyltransferase [Nocardioides sp. TF02-7]|uniref:FkbM family methyltransferase n=1 Tax=Nocardioides sp. TF02-7 TaxID=2917724 RepID=UPI001F05A666|nr:FkbM family methyltransferase [Nocardioides sp. TF02-7]UMG94063.1 FkbM family methyltransferase [Nocardioides sp. TF02-7]